MASAGWEGTSGIIIVLVLVLVLALENCRPFENENEDEEEDEHDSFQKRSPALRRGFSKGRDVRAF